jgi:hypothetical protein
MSNGSEWVERYLIRSPSYALGNAITSIVYSRRLASSDGFQVTCFHRLDIACSTAEEILRDAGVLRKVELAVARIRLRSLAEMVGLEAMDQMIREFTAEEVHAA